MSEFIEFEWNLTEIWPKQIEYAFKYGCGNGGGDDCGYGGGGDGGGDGGSDGGGDSGGGMNLDNRSREECWETPGMSENDYLNFGKYWNVKRKC